jgi:hypothetical protein
MVLARSRTRLAMAPPSMTARDSAEDNKTAELHIPLVIIRLRRRWPRADPEKVTTAAHDAILWYLANPNRYDSSSARLDVFLSHVSHRRLQDSYRRERRRVAHEVSLDSSQLALEAHERSSSEEYSQTERLAIRRRLAGLARTVLELRFLTAYLKTDDVQSCAAAIGVGDSPAAKAYAVHRLTMRLRQRAVRLRQGRDQVVSTHRSDSE